MSVSRTIGRLIIPIHEGIQVPPLGSSFDPQEYFGAFYIENNSVATLQTLTFNSDQLVGADLSRLVFCGRALNERHVDFVENIVSAEKKKHVHPLILLHLFCHIPDLLGRLNIGKDYSLHFVSSLPGRCKKTGQEWHLSVSRLNGNNILGVIRPDDIPPVRGLILFQSAK